MSRSEARAAPTILIFLGGGHAPVAELLARRLEAAAAVGLRWPAIVACVGEGADADIREDGATLSCSLALPKDATRAEIREATRERLSTLARGLIGRAEALMRDSSAAYDHLNVLLIGNFASPLTISVDESLLDEIGRVFHQRFAVAPLGFTPYGVFFVPDDLGDRATQAGIYAWLLEQQRRTLFRRIFWYTPWRVVSRTEGARVVRLRDEHLVDGLTEFAWQALTTGLLRRAGGVLGAGSDTRHAAFGITALEFPAREWHAYLVGQHCASLLTYYHQKPIGLGEASVSVFFRDTLRLTAEALYARLITVPGSAETVVTQLRFPPFGSVPLEHLPERIAEYGAWLGGERIRSLLRVVEDNAKRVVAEVGAAIEAESDTLLAGTADTAPLGPQTALAFLATLYRRVREEKDGAEKIGDLREVVRDPSLPTLPQREKVDLRDLNAALSEAIRHRPHWAGVYARYGLLGAVMAMAGGQIARLLGDYPFLVSLGPFAAPLFWFGGIFALHLLTATLVVAGAHLRISRRKREYIDAIVNRHRVTLMAYIHSKVVELLDKVSVAIDYQPQDRPVGESVPKTDPKRVLVEKFEAWLQEAASALRQVERPEMIRSVPAVVPIDLPDEPLMWFREQPEPPDFSAQLKEFSATRALLDWRAMSTASGDAREEFSRRLRVFADRGYRHVLERRITRLLRTEAEGFGRRWSDAATALLPAEGGGRWVFLVAADDELALAGVTPDLVRSDEQYRAALCEVLGDVPWSALRFVQILKSAYDEAGDRSVLHLVDDYADLLDPLAPIRPESQPDLQKDSDPIA